MQKNIMEDYLSKITSILTEIKNEEGEHITTCAKISWFTSGARAATPT